MTTNNFSEDDFVRDTTVTWQGLREQASAALLNSWSPYSNFRVGAAALLQDGRVVSGCNVENASYGVTLCAECSMTSANVSGGRSLFVAIVVVGSGTMPIAGTTIEDSSSVPPIIGPCGRCRQLMAEHSDENTQILSSTGPKFLIGDVLPYYENF